jgi:diamine N-acetyltransferase
MSLSVQPVTKENWRQLVRLKVREDQAHFVASNLYSIAESQFGFDHPEEGHWDMFAYGIYDDDTPVGFLMIGYNFAHQKTQGFIIRLMVDEQRQGKGYGKFGMNWILDHFRSDDRVKRIGISYEPENEVARKLYASLGFGETGEIYEGEVVAELQIH